MKREQKNWKTIISYIGCIFVALFVAQTAFMIEYWNRKAGGYFPRQLPETGNPKWRWMRETREIYEWEVRSQHITTPEGADLFDEAVMKPLVEAAKARELTPDEEADIQTRRDHAIAMNTLHGWVMSFGFLQYLCAPLSLVWIVLIKPWKRAWYLQTILWILLGTSSLSAFLMVYRGYFSSLGW